jgi:hypothetical protein
MSSSTVARLRAAALVNALACSWAFVFAFIPPMPLPWWAWLVLSFAALITAAFCDYLADEAEKTDGSIDL